MSDSHALRKFTAQELEWSKPWITVGLGHLSYILVSLTLDTDQTCLSAPCSLTNSQQPRWANIPTATYSWKMAIRCSLRNF